MSHEALATLRRTWWIPCTTLLLAVLVSLVLTQLQEPVYRGVASVVVTPNSELINNVRDEIDALDTLDRRSVVATLARLVKKRQVLDAAAAASGAETRGTHVRSVVPANTNIIEIHVDGPDPEACALLANEIAKIASREATELYRAFEMQPLDEAVERRSPIRPSLQRNLLAAAAVGLVAGLFLAVLADALLRVREPRDAGTGES